MMTKEEKTCLRVYLALAALAVLFFRKVQILLAGTRIGEAEEILALVFTVIGAIMLFVTGGKEHIGASIALSIVNAMLAYAFFELVAFVFNYLLL